MKFIALSSIALTTLSLLANPASAAEDRFYRFVNEQGNIVIQRSIPRQYVQNGYSIITASGKIIEEIKPALSKQDLLEQREQAVHVLAKEQQDADQASSDAALLKLYASMADLGRGELRELDEIEDRITVTQSNIQRLKIQRENKESRAADLERSNKKVPERILRDIKQIDDEAAELHAGIEHRRHQQQQVRERYEAYADRLKILLGVSEQEALMAKRALVKVKASQLGGVWNSRKAGGNYEMILNPKGSFSWISEMSKGEKRMLLGQWSTKGGDIILDVEIEQSSVAAISANHKPAQRILPILDWTEQGFKVDYSGEILFFTPAF